MRFLTLAFVGKPFQTLVEQKRNAWKGEPQRFRYRFPEADRWKVRIRRTPQRRKSA